MSDKTKLIIIKTITALGCAALLFTFLGAFVYFPILDEETANAVFIGGLITSGVFGATLMIMLPVFGLKVLSSKPEKAEKLPLLYDGFDALVNHIDETTEKNGYAKQPALSITNGGTLTTYVRRQSISGTADVFALVRIDELTDDDLESANDAITESLETYYGITRIEETDDSINVITVICVDRITPAFQKLVNGGAEQGFKNGRLPVGISFGGNGIYITKQNDGFAIAKYKRLRKEFLRIVGAEVNR